MYNYSTESGETCVDLSEVKSPLTQVTWKVGRISNNFNQMDSQPTDWTTYRYQRIIEDQRIDKYPRISAIEDDLQ